MSGRAVRWLWSLLRPALPASGREPRLTILRHHRVYPNGARPLYRLGVSAAVLEAQVAMLRGLGLGPCTVEEGLAHLAEGRPGQWVAMTFDDGYADNVERALPILEAAGSRATFYLTAGLIEERRAPWWDRVVHALERARRPALQGSWDDSGRARPLRDARERRRALPAVLRRLRAGPAEQDARLRSLEAMLEVESQAPCELATWDQARVLVEAGMEIGAHTWSHPFLDRLDRAGQEREIGSSLRMIEQRLGARVSGLAYPGGAYDAVSIEVARCSGLAYAVTTRAGDNGPATEPFALRRRGFDEGMCLGPDGRFSRRLARAELDGAFDALRGVRQEATA
ncbi:MAG: hypothetical protein E6K80_07385 [Candidatus Eisenbacteria bacterium]|uniref:NodB homology domain-containing protein n=1 Tax=Eiseniibacteriota bacterium TaxID=2212470 RepID=A0A538U4K1_UNCEI|nr:MAG: hypothetical protein E6K80_07385 [Candidatus Eisenbacteria bacterium]